MRQIARRFSGHTIDFQENRWELRLITTPLYEYEVKKREGADAATPRETTGQREEQPAPDALGGAVFALCQGTDTEIVLLIEARMVDGRPQYQYADATFTDYQAHLSLDEEELVLPPDVIANEQPHYFQRVGVVPKPPVELGQ
jgi:hypothetical protein